MANGNVTVQQPPDFFTSALQAYEKEVDRIERSDIRNEEKIRYDEQQELQKERLDRQEWQMMFDGAKNANQRNMVYTAGLNAGVSGLTPGMHDSIKNEAL